MKWGPRWACLIPGFGARASFEPHHGETPTLAPRSEARPRTTGRRFVSQTSGSLDGTGQPHRLRPVSIRRLGARLRRRGGRDRCHGPTHDPHAHRTLRPVGVPRRRGECRLDRVRGRRGSTASPRVGRARVEAVLECATASPAIARLPSRITTTCRRSRSVHHAAGGSAGLDAWRSGRPCVTRGPSDGRTAMHGKVLLAEEFVLLALDADGRPARGTSNQPAVAVGVTGALVTELVQDGHVEHRRRPHPSHRHPPDRAGSSSRSWTAWLPTRGRS